MFKTEFRKSIRYKFLKDMSLILIVSTFVLSAVIAINERNMLKDSLETKGLSLASNIAKRNENALTISGNIQLDSVLSDLITDEEIIYTIIEDKKGKILTSQFESINYKWPGLKDILLKLSKDRELPDIIAAIKRHVAVKELSVPIMIGDDTLGKVTIGMSEHKIGKQIVKTVLFVIALNLMVMFVLGTVLFITSKKTVLDPIIELGHTAVRFAKGDLSTRAEVKASGEVQLLVDSFNQMAEELNITTVSKNYVDNIIKSMIDTLIVISPDKKIVLANAAACKLLDYEENELIGKPIEIIFHDSLTASSTIIDEIFSKGFVSNVETAYQRKDGSEVLTLFSGSVISDENKTRGIVCVAIDITEVEKLKEELLKLDKLESVGVLAGGIAHDFNNLLQGVFGYISMAKMSSEKDGKTYQMLEKAERGLDLSINLTKQLLTYSKGGDPVKKVISLSSVIQDSVKFALSGSNINFSLSIDDNLWPVEADEGQIGQVIQNMVINAGVAMPNGGTVHIDVRNTLHDLETILPLKKGKYVLISIQDTGIGIPEHLITKIFDPYFTTKQKGSGLGLATSYSIVKKHGGIIEVKSKQGVGSTFFIYLPASEQKLSPIDQKEKILMTGRGKVLVMDDEEIVRKIAGEMIITLGYEVDFAVHGEEAIKKYTHAMNVGSPFDAVILDLTIKGGMGGRETMKKLIEIDPAVRAIVSSGYSDDPIMANYKDYGFKEALSKPFRLMEFSGMLHDLIEKQI